MKWLKLSQCACKSQLDIAKSYSFYMSILFEYFVLLEYLFAGSHLPILKKALSIIIWAFTGIAPVEKTENQQTERNKKYKQILK